MLFALTLRKQRDIFPWVIYIWWKWRRGWLMASHRKSRWAPPRSIGNAINALQRPAFASSLCSQPNFLPNAFPFGCAGADFPPSWVYVCFERAHRGWGGVGVCVYESGRVFAFYAERHQLGSIKLSRLHSSHGASLMSNQNLFNVAENTFVGLISSDVVGAGSFRSRKLRRDSDLGAHHLFNSPLLAFATVCTLKD